MENSPFGLAGKGEVLGGIGRGEIKNGVQNGVQSGFMIRLAMELNCQKSIRSTAERGKE